jgi:hypothetical protein
MNTIKIFKLGEGNFEHVANGLTKFYSTLDLKVNFNSEFASFTNSDLKDLNLDFHVSNITVYNLGSGVGTTFNTVAELVTLLISYKYPCFSNDSQIQAILSSIDSKVLTDAQLRATPIPISPRPNTTGSNGTTPYKLISLATTNAVSLKNSGGNLYSVLAIGLTSTVRYLKLYNKASAPTVGTDIPVMTIPVPANTQGAGVALAFSIGVNFTAGIAFAITSGSADSDTGAVGAGDVILNLTYA